jgi:hypothetical protein
MSNELVKTATSNEKYGTPMTCRISHDEAWEITAEAGRLGQKISAFNAALLLRGWKSWKDEKDGKNRRSVDLWDEGGSERLAELVLKRASNENLYMIEDDDPHYRAFRLLLTSVFDEARDGRVL